MEDSIEALNRELVEKDIARKNDRKNTTMTKVTLVLSSIGIILGIISLSLIILSFTGQNTQNINGMNAPTQMEGQPPGDMMNQNTTTTTDTIDSTTTVTE